MELMAPFLYGLDSPEVHRGHLRVKLQQSRTRFAGIV